MIGRAVACDGFEVVAMLATLHEEDSYCSALRIEGSLDGETWTPIRGAQTSRLRGKMLKMAQVRVDTWKYLRVIALGEVRGPIVVWFVPCGGE